MVPGSNGQSELLPGVNAHYNGAMGVRRNCNGSGGTPPKNGLVATASGTRVEPAATSWTRGVIAELSPAAGLCELVPGARAHNDGVQARGDSCDGAPRGSGHRYSILRARAVTVTFRSVGLGVR